MNILRVTVVAHDWHQLNVRVAVTQASPVQLNTPAVVLNVDDEYTNFIVACEQRKKLA